MMHYITHQSQQGVDPRVGDDLALVTARYEFEFGAQNSPSGQIFLFGWAALFDPFK